MLQNKRSKPPRERGLQVIPALKRSKQNNTTDEKTTNHYHHHHMHTQFPLQRLMNTRSERRKNFKEFIRIAGLSHVRTSPYYPQSNGKIERWHKSLKTHCISPRRPLESPRRSSPGHRLRRILQHRTASLRHRLRHPSRQTRRQGSRHLRSPRSKTPPR
jgi:transposase InsO family protein